MRLQGRNLRRRHSRDPCFQQESRRPQGIDNHRLNGIPVVTAGTVVKTQNSTLACTLNEGSSVVMISRSVVMDFLPVSPLFGNETVIRAYAIELPVENKSISKLTPNSRD
jgi:hypothetical protein